MLANPEAAKRHGFTLLEIIITLSIIAILGAIVIGILPDSMENSREDRAAADLIVIQQGLEAYRARFGDYPRYPDPIPSEVGGDESGYLLNVLNGRYGPSGDEINVSSFVKNALLVFESQSLPYSVPVDNRILDPWGTPYVYDDEPKNADNKTLFGYFLYSYGPDGAAEGGDDIYAK